MVLLVPEPPAKRACRGRATFYGRIVIKMRSCKSTLTQLMQLLECILRQHEVVPRRSRHDLVGHSCERMPIVLVRSPKVRVPGR